MASKAPGVTGKSADQVPPPRKTRPARSVRIVVNQSLSEPPMKPQCSKSWPSAERRPTNVFLSVAVIHGGDDSGKSVDSVVPPKMIEPSGASASAPNDSCLSPPRYVPKRRVDRSVESSPIQMSERSPLYEVSKASAETGMSVDSVMPVKTMSPTSSTASLKSAPNRLPSTELPPM